MTEGTHETVKSITDVISVGGTVGVLIGVLPAIAAFFTSIWMIIRIYESDTAQSIIKKLFKKESK